MSSFLDQIKQRYRLANVVEKIIYINVAVFVLTYLIVAITFLVKADANWFFNWFGLPSKLNAFTTKFWTIFTYGFLHDGFWHILFNMLLLYYLGALFLDFFSKKQFLTYYFSGIFAGGIIFLLSYNFLPALKNQTTMLVGASAGVTAVVIGLATKIPNFAIRFRFIGAVKLWYIAVAIIIIDVAQLPFGNTGGHLAHLGGAILGFMLTSQFNDGIGVTNFFSNLFTKKKQTPLKTVYKKDRPLKNINKSEQQEKIDAILDKISKSGYNSLTQKEKDFLFSIGKNK